LAVAGAFELCGEELERRGLELLGLRAPNGQEAAEPLAALEEVTLLLAVRGELAVRYVRDLLVGDRHVESVAKRLQVVLVELLLLVRDVLAFARRAHAEALDRLREDHGRP